MTFQANIFVFYFELVEFLIIHAKCLFFR